MFVRSRLSFCTSRQLPPLGSEIYLTTNSHSLWVGLSQNTDITLTMENKVFLHISGLKLPNHSSAPQYPILRKADEQGVSPAAYNTERYWSRWRLTKSRRKQRCCNSKFCAWYDAHAWSSLQRCSQSCTHHPACVACRHLVWPTPVSHRHLLYLAQRRQN